MNSSKRKLPPSPARGESPASKIRSPARTKARTKRRAQRGRQKTLTQAQKEQLARADSDFLTSKFNESKVHGARERKIVVFDLECNDFVKFDADTSPGHNRVAGFGFVQSCNGDGTFNIHAHVQKCTYKNVPMSALSKIPLSAMAVDNATRRGTNVSSRRSSSDWMNATASNDSDGRGYVECLVKCLQRNKFGSRRAELFPGRTKNLNHEERVRCALDKEFVLLLNDFTVVNIAHVWGTSKRQVLRCAAYARRIGFSFSPPSNETPHRSIIRDASLCAEKMTPIYFYLSKHQKENQSRKQRAQHEANLRQKWKLLSDTDKEPYKFAARSAVAAQPYIETWLIYELNCDPTMSFLELAAAIDHWCSAKTIQSWWNASVTAVLTGQRFVPLLSPRQRAAHVQFAKRVKTNWGRRPKLHKKLIWVHYDEKWFWGWLLRRRAKLDRARGLTKRAIKIKNKQHVPKAMFVCFAGFAFKGSPLNGGDGLKLGMVRTMRAKLNQRVQRARVDDPDTGTYTFSGEVVRRKGDARMVDCNVTGSSKGSTDAPKFDLKSVFIDHLFPLLRELTGPGGKYAGYDVVIQGDNAGPHREGDFEMSMRSAIKKINRELGGRTCWMWEPQAPHMPHSNVDDLAIFPSLSKLVQRMGRKRFKGKKARVLTSDQIDECVMKAWDEYQSCKIARTFVEAYLMMDKVIEEKGDTAFLAQGGFHFGVGKNFVDTDTGIKRKKKKWIK